MGGYNGLPELKIPQDNGEGIQRMVQLMGMLRQQKAQDAMLPGQLQQQQQQIQASTLENQQRAQQMKNMQVAPDVLKDWYAAGKDVNALPQIVAKRGGTIDLANSLIKQQQDVENLSKDQQANQLALTDRLLGHIDAIKGVTDPQQRSQVAQAQASQILKSGLHKNLDDQSQQMIQAVATGQMVPSDDQLTLFEKGLTAHKAQLSESVQVSDAAKNTADAALKDSQKKKIDAEMRFYQQKGLAPGVPLDAQEAADWMDKNPGKGPSDFMKYKAGLNPILTAALADKSAAKITDAALDNAAEKYWAQGVLPPGGRGPAVMAQNQKIMNRAAELHSGQSITEGTAVYAANKKSLEGLQKQFDQVTAFENTAGKNLDVFLNTAKKVVDSGSPWINKPLRAIDAGGLGGDDQAAFNAARTTALTEIAKVLNSSNATGVLSDSARHEVEGLIGPGATLKQIVSAANVLKQDMANRHQSYGDQIKDIQGRLGGNTPTAPRGGGGMIRARDQQGKLHEAPVGTALPAGWTLEK